MSDASQGPGWWIASDGRWYPPELAADYVAPTPPASAPPASEPPPLPVEPVAPEAVTPDIITPEPAPAPTPAPVVETYEPPATNPEPAWSLPTNAPTYEPTPAYEPTQFQPEPAPRPEPTPAYEPTPQYQPPPAYEPTPLPQTEVIAAVAPIAAAAATSMAPTAPPTEQWNLPAPPGPPASPVAPPSPQPMAPPQAPPTYTGVQPMGGVVKRPAWNYGAGVVVAEFVVAAMFAISIWSEFSGSTLPQDVHDMRLNGAIIAAVGAGLSLLALLMLSGTRAYSGLLAMIAGVATSVGFLWPQLDDWSAITSNSTETIVSILSVGAIPAVVGLLALGLRRSHPR